MNNPKKNTYFPRLSWFFLLLYFLFVSATAVFFVPPTWDEYLDFSGCVGAVNHLLAFLRGQPTDIVTITHDLEWYGNAYRWPAYLLWTIASGFPVRIAEGVTTYDQFLASSFSSSIHLVSSLYGVIGVLLFGIILQELPVRRGLRIFSIVLFAFSPIWLSNSFWNLKDLPVVIPLLCIILLSLKSIKSRSRLRLNILLVSLLLGTILSNKYAYFPLVANLALLFSFSIVFLRPNGKCLVSIKTKMLRFLWMIFVICLTSILFSFALTPQILGDIAYPVKAISYFASHPLVNYDHKSSLQFLLSRFSRLLSPSLMLLLILASLGFSQKLASLRRSSNTPIEVHAKRADAIIVLYAIVPALTYILPILSSGRTFYGPDLRHIIWLYPGLILLLTTLSEKFLSSLSATRSKAVSLLLSAVLGLTTFEIFSIYPHYYSFLGFHPLLYGAEKAVPVRRLVLSTYSPSFVPEVQSEMLRNYYTLSGSEPDSFPRAGTASYGSKVTRVTFPINPSYLRAYERLTTRIPSFPVYSLLGYKLAIDGSGGCDDIVYKKTNPLFFSSARVCR